MLAAWASASCLSSAQLKDESASWDSANLAEGRGLYNAVCTGCHGVNGRAEVAVTKSLFPRARDLTLGVYRFRTTASGTLPLKRDILRTLTLGLPGTAMPSWGEQLSKQQLMSVVIYLQSLAPDFLDEDLQPEEDDILVNPDTLKAPPSTPELLARGREVYKELKCFDCHGDEGRADGPSAKGLKNEDGLRAQLFDFTYGIYKGGNKPTDVYRTFMTGLDGTPMPSYADSVPEERDRWALVYHCLSLNRKRGFWFYLSERPTWNEPTEAE